MSLLQNIAVWLKDYFGLSETNPNQQTTDPQTDESVVNRTGVENPAEELSPIVLRTEKAFTQQLFNDKPHQKIAVLQEKIATKLMMSIGFDFLPKQLKDHLQHYDVYYAIQLFINSYTPYNFSYILKNPEDRNSFVEKTKKWKEIDEINSENPLNIEPLLILLKKDRETDYEILLNKFRRAQLLNKKFTAIVFFTGSIKNAINNELQKLLTKWYELDDLKINETEVRIDFYITIQKEFAAISSEIVRLLPVAVPNIPSQEEERMINEVTSIVNYFGIAAFTNRGYYLANKHRLYYIVEKLKCLSVSPEIVSNLLLTLQHFKSN